MTQLNAIVDDIVQLAIHICNWTAALRRVRSFTRYYHAAAACPLNSELLSR